MKVWPGPSKLIIDVYFRKQSQKSSVDNDGNDEDADFRDKDQDDEVIIKLYI